MTGNGGLTATLEVAQPVVVGLAALALLRIANSGPAPVLASARLNLMEGDISLVVTGPDGAAREIRGWQADTGLHRVELPPGRQLLGALNLLDAPDGPVFPAPGEYRLAANYTPSPQTGSIATPPVPVSVVAPRTAAERELAALLADPAVRRALVLGDRDSAPETVRDIAGRFAGTLEARLAGLVSGRAGTDEDGDPMATALAIVALTNPYSRTGERLAAEYASRFEEQAGDSGPEVEQALKLLRGEPLPTS